MKPKTPLAMQQLIGKVRDTLPFDEPENYVCTDDCKGCSIKLLEFLDEELINWEQKLAKGITPGLGDVQYVARLSKKIYRVLDKNGVLQPPGLSSKGMR